MAKANTKEGGAEGGNQKPIVLSVYLHCQECAKPIVKCLQDFPGVREVNTNFKAHTVSVKGSKEIDPKKLADKLQKKRNKLVEIISPTQKEMTAASQPKKSQPKINRVILSIYIHCENCGKNIMQNIQKMAGVQSVEMNIKNLQMMVKGEFEPQKLVEYVDKKMGKQSSIVKTEIVREGGKQQQQDNQQQRDNKKNKNKSWEGNGALDSPQDQNFLYMSQIFSDENSEACTIM